MTRTVIQIRATAADKAQVAGDASKAGLTVTEHVRRRLGLSGTPTGSHPPKEARVEVVEAQTVEGDPVFDQLASKRVLDYGESALLARKMAEQILKRPRRG